MGKNKLKIACAIVVVSVGVFTPIFTHAETPKVVKVNSFLSNDDVAIQYYKDEADKQKALEEKIAKQKQDEKAKQKAQEQKKEDGQEQSSSSSNNNDEEKPVTRSGSLRLSMSNDSRSEMVRKLNRFWAGHGLAGQGEAAVNAGMRYNIDPYILASISMTESTGGDYNAGSHNAWGRKASGGGWCNWGSWSEALDNEAAYLSHMYLDKGITSIDRIAEIYCPPTCTHWANEVRQHQREVTNK